VWDVGGSSLQDTPFVQMKTKAHLISVLIVIGAKLYINYRVFLCVL